MGHSHGADWVADSTLVGAVVGAVNRFYEHCPVVHGEADSVARMERPAFHHPRCGAVGVGGLAAEVGGAFVFYQDGCGAADGDSSYQRWQNIKSVNPVKMVKEKRAMTQRNRRHKNVL